ncbi:MAG: aminodeoxychorismate/anthranilate synthase component II [Candidatus Nitrohelix vancouverensis]|uniref:Aminodeoxychorismate/anthranilate synthase component II n=1 Tax=Candidatus Nitrohelix vancouverensis TaxID=2705534 RepID=A0A7T0C358_9BACT|nr:MAG: aminodeoxychorismate/anthranilate synthase component II [Candidatus Nitrohelix vancouverensis]
MILMIDNYDSFTYNLVQYLGELGANVEVRRNDKIGLEEIESLAPKKLVISPGPCTPEKAGMSIDIIRRFSGKIPLLGVCLGHQSIGVAFGGEVIKAKRIMHGKVSKVRHVEKYIFKGLPNPLEATRYHSLALNRDNLPSCFEITAESEDGEIMGIRHKELDVEGVQFHPESILTVNGKELLKNFIDS